MYLGLAAARKHIASLQAELAAAQLRESAASGTNHSLQAGLDRLQIAGKPTKDELHMAGVQAQQLHQQYNSREADRNAAVQKLAWIEQTIKSREETVNRVEEEINDIIRGAITAEKANEELQVVTARGCLCGGWYDC